MMPDSMGTRCFLASALVVLACLPAGAQGVPSEPIVLGGGHVTLGGEISWAIAPDDTGFFNYTDYERSTLRTLRLALVASVKAGDHVELLSEFRSENGERPEPYALYLRVRPWKARNLYVQAGRVPPTFGAFARRTYPADNPLIGSPLAYQYLTSIRADALPFDTDELLRMRGRGWLTNFTVGNQAALPGVPLVNAFRWDTGVQMYAGNDWIDAIASVTAGTVSNPQVHDDNGGRQLAGRLVLHPIAGLVIGGSAARGAFVGQPALRAARAEARESDFTQTAWGGDLEYSRGYYLVRLETVVSRWTLPVARTSSGEVSLLAVATSVEGRYKIRPGLYAAARYDRLGFNDVTGSTGSQSWEAPVSRWEVGGGYSLQRHLLLKLAYQRNDRDGGRVQNLHLASAQVVWWF